MPQLQLVGTAPAGPPSVPRELRALQPSDLPAPPEAALRVMEACGDEEVDNRHIGSLVETDPALTAELLRMVNSAWFGFAREVRSVSRAISIIGHKTLRNLVLCIAIRDSVNDEQVHGLDLAPFWSAALYRAVAARLLGESAGLPGDECFTLGMVQDLGLLALVRARPAQAGAWDELLAADPDERHALEGRVFGLTHDDVGWVLANAWHLPADLAATIGEHHRFGHEELPENADGETLRGVRLRRVAWCADWLAAVFSYADKRRIVQHAREALAMGFDMDAQAADALLAAVSAGVGQAAEALGMDAAHVSYESVLSEANLRLAEMNLDMQELNWRLQSALDARDRLAGALRRELDKARVLQRSLLPDPAHACFAVDGMGCPFYGVNAPARTLSGDFFDYFRLSDGRWCFNIADVSGKGVEAALMMARTSSLFRCLARAELHPGRLLAALNDELGEMPLYGMFVTMVAGVLDPANGELSLVNAGHPPPLLFHRNGEMGVIPAQAPPLGILPGAQFPVTEYALDGGSLYMFTDGLVEAAGHSASKLGYPGIVDLVGEFREVPPPERPARMLSHVTRTHGIARDDVTILLVEQEGRPADHAQTPEVVDLLAL